MTLRRKAWIIVAAAVVALPGMLYVSLRSLSVNGCLPATALTFGLVSGLLTLLLLERSVIAHLMQFSREVERISTTGNTALRLEITGEDELSRLGQAINKMLDSIERAESLRRQAQCDLRSILDHVHDAIFVHDTSGTIIDVNDRMLDLFRVSREEACCLSIAQDYSSPDNPLDRLQEIWRSVNEEDAQQFEWIARRPHDDSTFPVEVSLSKVSLGDRDVILANVRDVTERKMAEQSLRESEEQLTLALRGADLGLWDWNVQTGEMQLDERWTGMLGYSPDDVEPHIQSWQRLIHPEDAPRVLAALRAHFECRTSVYEVEYRLKSSSGDWLWVLARGRVVVRTRSGKPLRMTGTHLDITARKKAEAELQEAKLAAESANQAKSAFLANMSHEIRTPMTTILGFADTMLEPGVSDSERVNAAHVIRRNGEYLLSLINDILDLSRIEAGRMVVNRDNVSVCRLIAEVACLVRVRADSKNLAFDTEYIGPMPETILTDAVRLRQILVNLIGNAIKFTEVGGVRLVTRFIDGQQSSLQFDVIDTGIGMTVEQTMHLFEPFTQANVEATRCGGGIGLGLSISKRLAKMLGGDVEIVDTQPGIGTRFRFSVATGSLENVRMVDDPTSETLVVAEKPEEVPSEPSAFGDRQILLVEDSPDSQRLIAHILKKAGAHVTVADNGRTGVETAMTAHSAGRPFDIILMDMQMPVMDGYEATSQLRAAGYGGPIIALTAHAMVNDRERCLNAGCNDYVSKPIDRHALSTAISSHLLALASSSPHA